MQLTTALAITALLPAQGLALPYLTARAAGTPFQVTPEQLIAIGSKSASCGADEFKECTDAKKAAPFINASFKTYGITSPAVAGGIIATMMMESGEFKYARNHFPAPGKPGQGTRNMQSPEFNLEYFASIKELAPQAKEVGKDAAKALAILIQYGDYNFGSGAWFYKQHCKDAHAELEKGTKQGWEAYQKCIGASEDGRGKYWDAAVKALKITPSA